MTILEKLFFPVTLCAVLSCGLMAGMFCIFSICVMKALGQLPPTQGMAAMQSINLTIVNPLFFLIFFGAVGSCLFELVFALSHRHAPAARFLVAGAGIYLVGAFLVTMICNVPMNDALAAAKPGSSQGAALWANYLTTWTAWNHVRTVTSLAATACFAVALYKSGQP